MDTHLSIPNITFVIFTFNEEGRLPNIIKNFRSYGRILVVDNYSSDQTVKIARMHGCDVLMNKNRGWVEDLETTNKIKAAVQTEWLFWGFADELLSKEALADIDRVVREDKADIISILRRNYFYGEFCHDIAATYLTKAFKKEAIDFHGNTIHNFGRITVSADRVYKMPSDKFIHHLIINNAASYLNTINRYTDLEVSTKPSAALNRRSLYYLLLPFKVLWLDLFRKGGRQSGHAGLALSTLMMMYSLTTAMKGYEMQHGLDAAAIKNKYDALANNLLAGFD